MSEWKKLEFSFPQIPTMITWEERQYLYWLGLKAWTGEGHIIEIGPWLGGSTYCLAMGMDENSYKSGKKLHVFDNFIWREFMKQRAPLTLSPGESFRNFFVENVKRYESRICHYQQTLPDEMVQNDKFASTGRQNAKSDSDLLEWKINEPVEILFIDGAKSWTAMKHLVNTFYTNFIPGKTLIVCQDYKYWGAYWVIIIIEMMIDHLEIVHNLDFNTVTFKVKSKIPSTLINQINDFSNLSAEEGIRLIDNASENLRKNGDYLGSQILQLAKVRLLVHKGRFDDAIFSFRRSEAKWPLLSLNNNLESVRKWLESEVKISLKPSYYTKIRRRISRVVSKLRNASKDKS